MEQKKNKACMYTSDSGTGVKKVNEQFIRCIEVSQPAQEYH